MENDINDEKEKENNSVYYNWIFCYPAGFMYCIFKHKGNGQKKDKRNKGI